MNWVKALLLLSCLLAQLEQLEGGFCDFGRAGINQIKWLDGL
jgi:hypothetical protein